MPAPSTCICTLNIKNMLATSFANAELVCEPRKSFVYGTTDLILSRPVRVTATAGGVCTMTLVQSDSAGQKVTFTINYNDGNNFGTVVFDPITIPTQATLDLATVLTVSKG